MHRSSKAKNLFVAALVSALLGLAGGARGKPRPAQANLPKTETKATARSLFVQAGKDYALGRFEKALKGFEKAYELMPLPGFLFNIGQCYRMLNQYKKAIFFYEGYLSGKPDAPNREQVDRLILDCRALLKKQEDAAAAAAAAAASAARRARKTPKDAGKRPLVTVKVQPEKPKQYLPDVSKEIKPKPPFYRKWWFWTAIGAGVAAAVATSLAVVLSRKTESVLPSGSLGTVDLR